MVEFYQRRVGPEFADTSAAPMATLNVLENVEKTIGDFKKNRDEDRKRLLLSQYQNAATRAAVEAYRSNPTDFDGYDRDFAKNLRQSAPAVPLAEMGTYGAVANRTREHYYWTIAANLDATQKKSLKESVLDQYNDRKNSGIFTMKGQRLDPFPATAVYQDLLEAAVALDTTAADGTPLFTAEERAEKLAEINFDVLGANLDGDLNGDMPLEAVFQAVDPNFNYTVTIGEEDDPMVFQRNDLPPQLQKKFNEETVQKIGAFLKNQNDIAALDHFAAIYDGRETFIPGDKGDRTAGELYARAQMDRTPFAAETLDIHGNNLRWYLTECGFLPKAYGEKLTELCQSANPLAATIGAELIGRAIDANPAAAEALGDDVVTRALLISSQIQGGTSADVAVKRATENMDPILNKDRDAIGRDLKERKTSTKAEKFYGDDVTAEEYGYAGLAFFRHQVDANFLLNGGNRDVAVKQALAETKARYVLTNVGFYGGRGRRMADAPEKFYGPLSDGYVNEVLASKKKEISQKSGMPFDVDHVKLVATPHTEWALRSKQRPAWLLLRANDDGTTDYYINRETGRPLLFSLPDGAAEDIARQLEETRDMMSRGGFSPNPRVSLFAPKKPRLRPLDPPEIRAYEPHTVGEQVAEFFKRIWSRKRAAADGGTIEAEKIAEEGEDVDD